MNQDWMNHPKLNGLDKSKLELLSNLASQGGQKSQSELLPFLMAAASQGKEKGIHFSTDEISSILEVMKIGKSPQEAAKMDKIVSLMRMMR